MTIIAAGTSAQLIIAMLVVLLYTLAAVYARPFKSDSDDFLSSLTSIQLFLTLLGGLVMFTDDRNNPTVSSEAMGAALCAVNSLAFLAFLLSVSALHPRIKRMINECESRVESREHNGVKVSPQVPTKSAHAGLDSNSENQEGAVSPVENPVPRYSGADLKALRGWDTTK